MFLLKGKSVTIPQLLFYIIGNFIAWPLSFWVLYSVGHVLTGNEIGGYAFALFVVTTGAMVTLD